VISIDPQAWATDNENAANARSDLTKTTVSPFSRQIAKRKGLKHSRKLVESQPQAYQYDASLHLHFGKCQFTYSNQQSSRMKDSSLR